MVANKIVIGTSKTSNYALISVSKTVLRTVNEFEIIISVLTGYILLHR